MGNILETDKRIVVSVMPIHGQDAARNLGVPYEHPNDIEEPINNREVLHIGAWKLNSYSVHPETKIVLQWAGSDILKYEDTPEWKRKKITETVYKHACNDERAKERLAMNGIDAVVCPFYPYGVDSLADLPIPGEFVVGMYVPTNDYYPDLIYRVASRGHFVIVSGATEKNIQIGNVFFLGMKGYNKHSFYGSISCLVRMTAPTHFDSLPRGLIEGCIARRHIITDYKMPYWEGGRECVKVIDTEKEIDRLYRSGEWKQKVSKELSDRWIGLAEPGKYKDEVDKLFGGKE